MYLGIDIGTSGVKAVVIGADGSVAGQGTAALAVSRPQPLWSEQSPDDWWEATCAAVRAIDPAVRRSVRGIGLGGQMHGATLLDANDRPLRPAILWNDGRSYEECDELTAAVPGLAQISGNLAMPGFTAPKLMWIRKHEPEIFAKVATVLLPKDYVRLRMTGEKVSDMSDSAGTLWLDVAGRRWSDQILAATGLTAAQMPRLVEGSEIAGTLLPDIAALWGVPQVPVVGGGGDNAAGAVHAFCHCLPGMWHQMSVHLSAASCIDWIGRITGAANAPEVFARAEGTGPGGGPELFLPYLSGERTPHNDALVRGAFLNLDNDSDAARLSQAVLEGVAFALADGLTVLEEAGTTVDRLAVIGGGARSGYWGTILAAALETPLVYLRGGEVGPAMGGARLAQLGVEGGAPRDVCIAPPVDRVVEPDPELVARLAPKREAFRAAYSKITPKKGL